MFVRLGVLCACTGNAKHNFCSNSTAFKTDADSNRQYETVLASVSVVAYFIARVSKELALTKMFCIKKEKAEVDNYWRNSQGLDLGGWRGGLGVGVVVGFFGFVCSLFIF